MTKETKLSTKLYSLADTAAKAAMCKCGGNIKGEALASVLNNAIGDGEDRAARIAAAARAAGISASTMQNILAGEINCPPERRLRGFASSLSVGFSTLRRAAERDGCSYD